MDVYEADVAIIGAGGAGLRAALAIADLAPGLRVALVSKVLPMRSHTVAAEGGAAGVVQPHDSLELHFHDTVAGGDWLCDQDVVDYFVRHCRDELVQLEHWGCPWSRKADGHINVRAFGGMKVERTWFAADKTGFHMLHTLFQNSLKRPSIRRFDEHFCCDLLVDEGRCTGLVTIDMASGEFTRIDAGAVVLATGGAGRVFRENTNGGIVNGDGMALAYRHGVALRDMEFVQYHPTCMLGTGLLFTEGCRGEGGILVNKDGYRYLQDYGLGPPDPWPRTKAMELGPRDRLSQAFWHEQRKGRTIETPRGHAVHLDLRHLGRERLRERLPLICELAQEYLGIDPASAPIPVRPSVHYTMGGIHVNLETASAMPGLFAAGECASNGLHGANRLGSNSLVETVVFGRMAGERAARHAREAPPPNRRATAALAADAAAAALQVRRNAPAVSRAPERTAALRKGMAAAMEEGCGIYRTAQGMQACCDRLAELKARSANLVIQDRSGVWNTEWLQALELGYQLDVAEAIAHSALNRRESRGAHQRLDGFEERDDANYLCHTLARKGAGGAPAIGYGPVVITRSAPGVRAYGAEGESIEKQAERDEKEALHGH